MTVVVSAGRTRPAAKAFPLPTSEPTTRGPSRGTVDLIRGDGLSATYEGMVRSQPWLFAVVSKLTWGGGRLPFNAYERGDGDARQRARGHPLDVLLRRPVPGRAAMAIRMQGWWDLLVHGRHLMVKFRPTPGAPPTQVWPVPWRYVQTVEDESGVIGWLVQLGGRTFPVGAENAIYTEMPGGISPIEPLRRTLALEDAAIEWQGQSFSNGVTPRGAFVSDTKLDDRTMPRLRAELEKLYAGPENGGRFGLFDQGLKWSQMGQSAVDSELIGQRKLSREEVCGAYDVAPPLVGILDRATFNNIDVLHTAHYVDSLGPKITLVEDSWQAQLVEPEPSWDGLFVEHNLNDVLRPDAEARMRAYLMSQQSSTTTIDERRAMENLPPLGIAGVTDVVLIPANMTPAGAPPADAGGVVSEPAAASLATQLTAAAFTAGASGDSDATLPDMEDQP